MAQNRRNVGQIGQLASPLEKSNQGPKTSGQEVQPTSCTGAGVDRIQIPFSFGVAADIDGHGCKQMFGTTLAGWEVRVKTNSRLEKFAGFVESQSSSTLASVVHVDHNARVVCTRYTSMLISFWQGPCIYLQSTMQVRNFLQWVLLRI